MYCNNEMIPQNSLADFIAQKTDSATEQTVQHKLVFPGKAALTRQKREVNEVVQFLVFFCSGFSCVNVNI